MLVWFCTFVVPWMTHWLLVICSGTRKMCSQALCDAMCCCSPFSSICAQHMEEGGALHVYQVHLSNGSCAGVMQTSHMWWWWVQLHFLCFRSMSFQMGMKSANVCEWRSTERHWSPPVHPPLFSSSCAHIYCTHTGTKDGGGNVALGETG